MLYAVIKALLLVALLVAVCCLYFRTHRRNLTVFFHPNCLDCGGGEKVLWEAVAALEPHLAEFGIYCEGCTHEECDALISPRFNLTAPSKLRFIRVGQASFLKAGQYKRFTLIRQGLGSIVYAFRCLLTCVPSVVIDTTGAPFANLVWKVFGGCKVVLYTHYPFISTDMLTAVTEQREGYNNSSAIAKSRWLSKAKLLYYKSLCYVYGKIGSLCDISLVNSTWTKNHIEAIFGTAPTIVYPPCDVSVFSKFPLENREHIVLSVGQFRPEKVQMFQLQIFEHLKDTDYTLYIVGGCRNAEDTQLKDTLQQYIDEHSINAKLLPNVTYNELKDLYSRASIGLHTMYNEHFGICAVEYMAAGLIPVCNKSGGPLLDIVKDESYLALELDEYLTSLKLAMSADVSIREHFREQSLIFSTESFRQSFYTAISSLL